MNALLQEKLKSLPKKPGSYQYKDINGEIIYVGKAKNLYNRVHSYFVGSHDAKTTKLVSQIVDMDYTITSSEIEALILEINLIKRYRPKYNIMLMDDKQYPYIVITNEANPRVIYTRDIDKRKGKIYGPYPNAKAAKEVVDMIGRMFPLRKCNKIPKKECLYYHMGQCLAPCINKIDKSSYDEVVNKINNILKGNVKDEIKLLTIFMEKASDELNFEKAIEYRNLIESLRAISEKQKMEGYLQDSDIFGYYQYEDFLSIQIFHLRDGKMIERKGYLLDLYDNDDIVNKYQDFVVNFYLLNNNPIPRNIIISDGDIEYLENSLNTNITIPQKGKKKELLDLVKTNAKNKVEVLLKSKEIEYKKSIGAIKELEEILGVDNLHLIEMFDNSNIMGSSPVSAMIVLKDGVFDRSSYRKYKIKTVVGANDVATMYEVVTRRYKDIENNPDLIIMDGGVTQVNSCLDALRNVNRNINVLGLIKNDKHKTEALYFKGNTIAIDKHSYAFKLLEKTQEEVHRYAISFFRSTHLKDVFSSKLLEIEGIGEKKKDKILLALKDDNPIEAIKKINLNDEQYKQVIELCSLEENN